MKFKTKEDYMMHCKTQAGNIITNLKIKIDFTSPRFSATKIITWKWRVDESDKGGYNIILGRYILTAL